MQSQAAYIDSVFVNNAVSEPVPVRIVAPLPLQVTGNVSAAVEFPTFFEVTQSASSNPWIVSGTMGRNWFLNEATDSVSVSGTATIIQRLIDISTNIQTNTSSTALGLSTANTSIVSNGVTLGLINQSIVSNTLSTSAAIGINTAAVNSNGTNIVNAVNANTSATTTAASATIAAINAVTATISATAQTIAQNQTTQITNAVSASNINHQDLLNINGSISATTVALTTLNTNTVSGHNTIASNTAAIFTKLNQGITVSQGTTPWVTSGTFIISSASFTRIKQRQFFDSEEIRYDIPTNLASGTIFIGVAASGTATSTAAWSVVRTSFTSESQPLRDQFRTGISWDARAAGF